MNSTYVHGTNLLLEIIIAIWFYRGLPNASKLSSPRQLLAIGCLLLQAPLFNAKAGLFMAVLRVVARTACFAGYLRLSKKMIWSHAAYIAGLGALCFTIANNFWGNPFFYSLREMQFFPNLSDTWNQLFTLCFLRYTVVFLALCIPKNLLPFKNIHTIQKSQVGMLVIIVCVELYVKESVYIMVSAGSDAYYAITLWLIFLQLFLLLFLVIMERAFCDNEQRTMFVLQEATYTYRIQALKSRLNSTNEVRRLHHDMKNHLLAIDAMAEKQEIQQIRDYISSLRERVTEYENSFDTGRTLLNGLLSEKSHEAAEENIPFYVDIHLPDTFQMTDADLCTIFGNLVDNAIEACRMVDSPQDRFFRLKGRMHAGRFFVTMSNSCSPKKWELHSGLPITTKQNPYAHGFGLQNVRDTVEKYGGMLTFDHETPNRVTVTFSIPVQTDT